MELMRAVMIAAVAQMEGMLEFALGKLVTPLKININSRKISSGKTPKLSQ